jgi:tetratricopeptide (TPR) repeat protein
MEVDYRPDHSFRIPRPDLTVEFGVPNACNRCHIDKTPQWSEDYVTKWYGPGRRFHYGAIIAQGRQRVPEDGTSLIQLAGDALYPVIVRATALSLLEMYPREDTLTVFERSLLDGEALIRQTAIAHLPVQDQERKAELLAPLLYDPVKAVRIEAARQLAGDPSQYLDADQQRVFRAVLTEYETAMYYSADFSFGRYNLGNLAVARDRLEEAIRHYKAAIAIDDLFFPGKVNLAMVYNQTGKNQEAEILLREVLSAYPEMYETAYSLGLLLAEEQEYDEAMIYLTRAAKGMPAHSRAHYNLGLLFAFQGRDGEAEQSLLGAVKLEPTNADFLYAVADFYLKRGRFDQAELFAEQLAGQDDTRQLGQEILRIIKRMEQQ